VGRTIDGEGGTIKTKLHPYGVDVRQYGQKNAVVSGKKPETGPSMRRKARPTSNGGQGGAPKIWCKRGGVSKPCFGARPRHSPHDDGGYLEDNSEGNSWGETTPGTDVAREGMGKSALRLSSLEIEVSQPETGDKGERALCLSVGKKKS